MVKRALAMLGVVGIVACGAEPGAPDPGTGTPTGPTTGTPSTGGGASSSGASGSGAGGTTGTPTPGPLGAPYPIVLMHGMSGFGKLEVGPIGITYFDGVVEELTKHGEQVFVTLAPPYDTSEERAKEVAKQIDHILKTTGKAKVNLVGHSQGGMDARVIASPQGLGYGDRIASVTTVATPHRGSRVADVVLKLIENLPPSMVDDLTGNFLQLIERTAFELDSDPHLRAQLVELSEKHMSTVFNPKYKDDARVHYASYAGRTNLRDGKGVCDTAMFPNDAKSLDPAQPLLAPLAIFLEGGKGIVNDGLVTVESSKWGTFQQCVAADHLKEVGQLGPFAANFDHIAFFDALVERIRNAGD